MTGDFAVLFETEIFWRDRQKWLEDRGYMLRPRYRPDWKPSWLGSGMLALQSEDGIPLPAGHKICDATRISDGADVALRIINTRVHPHEVEVATFLSSKSLAADPNNHCIPIYEVLEVPDGDGKVIVVMPLLRQWDNPSFGTIGEAVDFFTQLFQGLQFMHKHHVAHRDISVLNVMMDGSMFPEGWHFCQDVRDRQDPSKMAKHGTRTQCSPKYYLAGLGLSRRYDPTNGSPLERPIYGDDMTVPEFQKSTGPCNPFPTDIYYAGNLVQEGIFKEYESFKFMQHLISDMVQDDPEKRPTIDEVVNRFEAIKNELGNLNLRLLANNREESLEPVHGVTHLLKTVTRTV
jgi:serine/threonine protein kinase